MNGQLNPDESRYAAKILNSIDGATANGYRSRFSRASMAGSRESPQDVYRELVASVAPSRPTGSLKDFFGP